MDADQAISSFGRETSQRAWPNSYASIVHGLPFQESCAKHVSETFKASRVLIIASASLSRDTDCVNRLESALGDKVVFTRYGMRPHTLWSEVLEVTEKGRELKADLIVTLGAGSLIDGAKVVALAMANQATSFDDLHRLHSDMDAAHPPTVPIISIPTSLSGGEFSDRAGASHDDDHRKYSFAAPTKGPALVIWDPELTTTTPDRWWLSTGIRAVDHCVECLCSLKATDESDEDATNGLQLLIPNLLRCKKDNKDLTARLNCQKGVLEAMKAASLHGVPMGASHGIGHQLGPLGVGHGETSCILLPAVCRYNYPVNSRRQEKARDVLWSDSLTAEKLNLVGLTQDADLADMLDVLFRELNMPRSLKDVGLDGGDDKLLDMLARNSLHDRCCPTNPIPLESKDQVLDILAMCKG